MLWAFIDESGQPNLNDDIESVGTHYVLCCVLVDESEVDQLRFGLDTLAADFASGSELKAKRFRRSDERRIQMTRSLSELPFRYYAVVVEKRRLDPASGFRFAQTFHKYFHGVMYRWLYESNEHVAVKADEIGRSEYMESFEPYIQRKRMRNLFDQHELIEFLDSRSERGIQAADLLAGYEADKASGKLSSATIEQCEASIADRRIGLHHWGVADLADPRPGGSSARVDRRIAKASLRSVLAFLDRSVYEADEDEALDIAVELARVLQLHLMYGDEEEYLYADALAAKLTEAGVGDVTVEQVRRGAIPRLRDAGVLVVSTDGGYKLPVTGADVEKQLLRDRRQLRPRLSRLRSLRQKLTIATDNEYDPFLEPQHAFLDALLKASEDC